MPAPMPIQIRYGPSGLLAQAAEASGGYAGQVEASRYAQMQYAQKQAQDMSFLAQQQNQLMQRNQMQYQREADQQRLELEAQRLQMAQRGATPTSNAAMGSSSPLARSIENMKMGYLSSAMSEGVTGDARTMLETAVKDPDVSVDAFQRLSQEHGNVARKEADLAQTEANRKAATADKQATFDSLSSQLPDAMRDAFKAQITDGSVSSTQYRMGIATLMQQREQADAASRRAQITGIDDQIDTSEARIRDWEKIKNVDPNAVPASYNPTITTERPGVGRDVVDVARNALQGLTGTLYSPNFVEDATGGTKNLQDRIGYQRELNNLANLQKQRNALANPKEAFAAQGGSQPGQQITPELARQFMAAAGGDPVQARQLAASKGYSF